jgi:hypothetical protein
MRGQALSHEFSVIVREGGRSSNRRRCGFITDAGDYWIPAFAGMTTIGDDGLN